MTGFTLRRNRYCLMFPDQDQLEAFACFPEDDDVRISSRVLFDMYMRQFFSDEKRRFFV